MIYNIFIAIGVFAIVAVLLAETIWQRRHQKLLYQISDTVTNTACGISDRVFNIFFDTIQFVLWTHLYQYVAIVKLEVSLLNWIICLLVVDFIWYWYHRLGHEVRFFWAVHSLHHQSEEFNISVGFRISIFQSILRGTFWLLLPTLGFSPELILSVLVFHGLYQLPLHTRVIPKIPYLDWIFVTPSNHRVHHGVNEPYLDKNYGGVLMIWDRLFGTYAEETEEVDYGITDKPGNLGFIQSHLYGFRQLVLPSELGLSRAERFRYIFSKPSYTPVEGLKHKPKVEEFKVVPELSKYVLMQLVMASVVTITFIFFRESWNMPLKTLQALIVGWTLASATIRYQQVSVVVLAHEVFRNFTIAGVFVYMSINQAIPIYLTIMVLIVSLISLLLLPVKRKKEACTV